MGVLLALAVGTAALSYYTMHETPADTPSHRPPRRSQPAPASQALQQSEADAAAPMEGEEEVDPFAPRGWQPPPPVQEAPKVVAAPEPPPAPAAPPGPPPLPYKFMGRMNDGDGSDKQMVYLSKGDQVAVVQGGETLDGTYKVLHVETDHIEFEHMPTGEKQVLNIAANDK